MNKNNWFPAATLIIGNPGETDDDVKATIDLIYEVERRGLFGRERVAARLRVVLDVAARGLVDEPLAHVALLRARARGQLRRRRGAGPGQGLVEPEAVAQVDEQGNALTLLVVPHP